MNPSPEKKRIEEGLDLLLQFDKRGGVLPTIVQDANSNLVLMLAYSNHESVQKTLETGYVTLWSTSKKELWVKGATSGDRLKLVDMGVDCDQDAILYSVINEGKSACHTATERGIIRPSCFYRKVKNGKLEHL